MVSAGQEEVGRRGKKAKSDSRWLVRAFPLVFSLVFFCLELSSGHKLEPLAEVRIVAANSE